MNEMYTYPTPQDQTPQASEELAVRLLPPAEEETPDVTERVVSDEVMELGEDFDFNGFQVVRREFFAHLREPSVTFNNCRFYVNKACLNKFPLDNSVQVMINREKKILALRPCDEFARDSYVWCNTANGKRKPRQVTCKLFFAKIVSFMNWNPDYKYKLLGQVVHANGEYLLAFDLTATEVYKKKVTDDNRIRTSRVPVYPGDWQDQFGLPYNEHKQSMQINIFDGYAIYAIRDKTTKPSDTKAQPTAEERFSTGEAAAGDLSEGGVSIE